MDRGERRRVFCAAAALYTAAGLATGVLIAAPALLIAAIDPRAATWPPTRAWAGSAWAR